MIKIASLEELDRVIETNGQADIVLALVGGLRSSKTVTKTLDGKYEIFNNIDGSTDVLDSIELFDPKYTNIGVAINKDTLYLEQD